MSLNCTCSPIAHLGEETKKFRNELWKWIFDISFLVFGSNSSFFIALDCKAEIRSSRATQPSVNSGHTHARPACRGEPRLVKTSLRPVPCPGIWGLGHPHYWPSSSGWVCGGWWEAVESSSTRSPWSPQSSSSNRCGRRLSAACVWASCGDAPCPDWARKGDEVQTGRPSLTHV